VMMHENARQSPFFYWVRAPNKARKLTPEEVIAYQDEHYPDLRHLFGMTPKGLDYDMSKDGFWDDVLLWLKPG